MPCTAQGGIKQYTIFWKKKTIHYFSEKKTIHNIQQIRFSLTYISQIIHIHYLESEYPDIWMCKHLGCQFNQITKKCVKLLQELKMLIHKNHPIMNPLAHILHS